MDQETVVIHAQVTASMKDALARYARARGVSVSEAVRQAIEVHYQIYSPRTEGGATPRPFTKSEDRYIRSHWKDYKARIIKLNHIASALDREPSSILGRAVKLGLREPSRRHRMLI